MVLPEPFGYTALVARESTEQQSCCLKEEHDWLVDFYVMCMIIYLLRVKLSFFGSSLARIARTLYTRTCHAPLTLPNCQI